MASAVCKSQPPKARKRVIVSLPTLKEGAANGSKTTRCEFCNKDIPASAAGIHVHDCVEASIPVKSVVTAAKDAAKAKLAESESKRTRKRKSATDETVEMALKSAKAKKEKDPNEPKRPPTAFILFMEEFRQTYKIANPTAKGAVVVTKEGGEKWKSMSDEAKEPFIKKCADMKEEYQKALKSYKFNGKEVIESTITDNAEEKCGVDESCEETAASADHTSEAEQGN